MDSTGCCKREKSWKIVPWCLVVHFSSVGICIYLVIALLVAPESSVEINFLIIAAILIPMQFLRKASTGINLGWKPQLLGYGSIISGIVSVPLALFLIYFLDWSIIGIVFSLAIAEGANIIFQVVCAREKIKAKIDFAILKRWFKFSWVPLYPKISNLLVMSDVIVFSLNYRFCYRCFISFSCTCHSNFSGICCSYISFSISKIAIRGQGKNYY